MSPRSAQPTITISGRFSHSPDHERAQRGPGNAHLSIYFKLRYPSATGWERRGRLPISETGASRRKEHAMTKNTICLWYDKDAEAGARFYAETFPDTAARAVHRAPVDYPSGKAGGGLAVDLQAVGRESLREDRGKVGEKCEDS